MLVEDPDRLEPRVCGMKMSIIIRSTCSFSRARRRLLLRRQSSPGNDSAADRSRWPCTPSGRRRREYGAGLPSPFEFPVSAIQTSNRGARRSPLAGRNIDASVNGPVGKSGARGATVAALRSRADQSRMDRKCALEGKPQVSVGSDDGADAILAAHDGPLAAFSCRPAQDGRP